MFMVIWTEKYRPKTFEEIKGQEEIVKRAKAFVKEKNLPHLIFAGPAGVGKTTLALVITKELFKEKWRENFVELNASDERGIDVIRNKVKDFARTKPIGDASFKIILLDECDALTKEAQQALRRTMEVHSQSCRFILNCNLFSKIIEPIQSRCAVFKFKPLSKENLLEIIDRICHHENLKIDAEAKEALITASQGDCRKLENILQSCAVMGKTISKEQIYSISSLAEPKEVKEVLELSLKGQFVKAREKLLEIILEYGLSGIDVIKQFQKEVWGLKIPDLIKMKLIEKCGEIEFRLSEGSDQFIQLESFLAYLGIVKEENS